MKNLVGPPLKFMPALLPISYCLSVFHIGNFFGTKKLTRGHKRHDSDRGTGRSSTGGDHRSRVGVGPVIDGDVEHGGAVVAVAVVVMPVVPTFSCVCASPLQMSCRQGPPESQAPRQAGSLNH